MASATLQTRSRSRKNPRVRYTYDSESEFDSPPPRLERPSRTAHRVQTYREISDESDNGGRTHTSTSSSSENEIPPQSLRVLRSRQPPVKRSNDSTGQGLKRKALSQNSKPPRPFATFKRRKIDTHNRYTAAQPVPKVVIEIPSNDKIPPWQDLPYQLLQSIMRYAAFPLYGEASRSTLSISWLCDVSLLCRNFHEACIAALLYSPPLYPSFRAHGLLALLRQNQDNTVTTYRNKIRSLDIEVKHLLLRKSSIDLEQLLECTPLLERLRLYHNHDYFQHKHIWAHPSASNNKWSYPEQLFEKLDNLNIHLKFFEWNGRFPTTSSVLHTAIEAHLRSCMSELQELSFMNLTLPERTSEEDLATASDLLALSIGKLTNLRHLHFHNCNIIDESTIIGFPPGLVHLEFKNCPSLTSSAIENYLLQKGHCLESLRLSGNQVMSLGFLANLKILCPLLRYMYIDLTYTDPTSYRDRDPLFDELLPNGPPTWPSGLVHIEIENLRQLSATQAEEFFQSLVDAASDLCYLRHLSIKAILKEASWRDRAEMRRKWIPTLQRVFSSTFEKTTEPSNRQSRRIARNVKKLNVSDDSGDSDSSVSQSSTQDDSEHDLPRQGRCGVVELMLSDQRPAQDQFHENDFLDDEPSGDEEWTGQNEEPDGYGYAW